MENWAIVIGINKYWEPEACLGGAVKDALSMMEWLLSKKGGNVPAKNLKLCLSPNDGEKVPDGIAHTDATQQGILDAIDLVEKEYRGQGKRLFFYYAGHGVNYLSPSLDSSALVPTDLRQGAAGRFNTNIMLSMSSIIRHLKNFKFEHQFFFIDACRNIPFTKEFWNGKFNPGGVPGQEAGASDFALPGKNQFILYATSSGFAANELWKDREFGVFTDVLLKGLSDQANAAKVYDDAEDKYKLIVTSLFEYVRREVEKKKLQAGEEWEDVIQIPEWIIQGNEFPEFAVYEGDFFDEVYLDVDLDRVVAKPEIYLYTADQIKDRQTPSGAPVRFLSLKPRKYGIVARSSDHEPENGREVVHLWGPEQKTIKMRPKQGPPGVGDALIIRPRTRGLRSNQKEKSSIIVECDDPLAPLEVADDAGKTLLVGTGKIFGELPLGFYQARLINHEGRPVSVRDVILTGTRVETAKLIPPEPFAASTIGKKLIEAAEFDVGEKSTKHIPMPKNTLGVSESSVGAIANPELSTVLALAGTASTIEKKEWFAGRLRRIGVASFAEAAPKASTGLQVLFAFDAKDAKMASTYTSEVKLALWSFGKNPSEATKITSLSIAEGLAGYSKFSEPGSYCLSIELPGQKPIVFYVSVLPHRLTLMVFQQTANGQIRVFQYMPNIGSSDAPYQARFTRRMELLQHFYMNGRLDHARDNAREMLGEMRAAKREDPLFGCLSGYVALKSGEPKIMDALSTNKGESYNLLPDSNVLQAEYYIRYGSKLGLKEDDVRRIAKEEYSTALDNGLPIFADGIALLWQAVRRYEIRHDRAGLKDAFENRVRGLLWSAKQ